MTLFSEITAFARSIAELDTFQIEKVTVRFPLHERCIVVHMPPTRMDREPLLAVIRAKCKEKRFTAKMQTTPSQSPPLPAVSFQFSGNSVRTKIHKRAKFVQKT